MKKPKPPRVLYQYGNSKPYDDEHGKASEFDNWCCGIDVFRASSCG